MFTPLPFHATSPVIRLFSFILRIGENHRHAEHLSTKGFVDAGWQAESTPSFLKAPPLGSQTRFHGLGKSQVTTTWRAYQSENFGQAATGFTALIRNWESNCMGKVELQCYQGISHLLAGAPSTAEGVFQEVIQQGDSPWLAASRYFLAWACFMQGRHQDAFHIWKTIVLHQGPFQLDACKSLRHGQQQTLSSRVA